MCVRAHIGVVECFIPYAKSSSNSPIKVRVEMSSINSSLKKVVHF